MRAVLTAVGDLLTDRLLFAVAALAAASAALLYAVKGEAALAAALDDDVGLFATLLAFVPAVLLLSALFEVMMPRRLIERWLGAGSGFRGIMVATLAGMFTPGGPFLAFPIVVALRNAGAGWAPLVTYISSWSLISVTRVLVFEMPFVGVEFALTRFACSIALPVMIGLIADRIVRVWTPPDGARGTP